MKKLFLIVFILMLGSLPFFYHSSTPRYDVKIYNIDNKSNYPIMRYNRVEVINNDFNSISIKYSDTIIVILKSKEFKMEITKCLN